MHDRIVPFTPRKRRRAARFAALAGLLMVAVATLPGCEAILVTTGLRMRLDDVPLQSITATLAAPRGMVPGTSAPLSIVALAQDGRTLATVGTGDGKVLPDSYRFQASIVTCDEDGVVTMPEDPRLTDGHVAHVRITPAGRASPVADVDVVARYDAPFEGVYAGDAGRDGASGMDGFPGPSGAPGSFDPDHPSAGGDGSSGTSGSDGTDGGEGGPGPDVHVWISLAPAPHPLLRVRVSERGQDHFFAVDPAGGSLRVVARGGHGGSGGAGGRGGSGGSGGMGQPDGASGNAGSDGRSGFPGRGGASGRITVSVDPAARVFLDRFRFVAQDGEGRAGPAPVVITEPVPRPW